MTEWLTENLVHVLGWVAGLVLFAFVFGRRFQKLEDADARMATALTALTETVGALANSVNGANGNAALSRSLDHFALTLGAVVTRVASTEERVGLHEVRLARLDEMRASIDKSIMDFYDRKWDPLTEQVAAMRDAINRIDVRLAENHRG